MKKIFLILRREYLVRVKKKSFIIMTFLTPLLFAGLMIGSAWLATSSGLKEDKVIRVLDKSDLFVDQLENSSNITYTYIEGTYQEAKKAFEKSDDFALLYIPDINAGDPSGIKLLGRKSISVDVQLTIEKKLKRRVEDIRLLEAGIDKEVLAETRVNVDIDTKVLGDETGEEKDSSSMAVYIIGFGAAFLIYMSVFIYGVQVMRGVIEEKTNRIVEVIISSVKPIELMLGKITGVALVGLTQFLLWIVLTLVLASAGGSLLGLERSAHQAPIGRMQNVNQIEREQAPMEVLATPKPAEENDQSNKIAKVFNAFSTLNYPLIVGAFLFYFVFGYLLYSAMFAAVGSAGDSETDAQQFTFPVSIPLILSFVMAQFVINEPDGVVAFWGSMIPFTSPIIMMLRIPYGVPAWQLALSMASLVLGFVLMAWLASRIYRVGILMYGKKITYKELGKWLFTKN
ncbi:MAG: ABC transporter permease [Thermonemataceae bacterium]